jgi:AraC family transcriptional regulator of adaptative response / DNA-3-methyladenine glycosylase II
MFLDAKAVYLRIDLKVCPMNPTTDDQNEVFEKARQTRDARFDGRFFIAVRTTGIYCRPVCKVRMPKAENVTFYLSAAAASEAGYRPCLRCRPEAAPGTPAWSGTSATVKRGLRLISDGALDEMSIEQLGDKLGVTGRHLSRLFNQHLGASPQAIAQTRRLHFAKKLISETNLPMTEIALSSGYGSVRRFNDHFRKVYDRSPTMLRDKRGVNSDSGVTVRLPYREPFDFEGMLAFLAMRAVPQIESIGVGIYQRSLLIDGESGLLSVSQDIPNHCLICRVELSNTRPLMKVVDKVKGLFDLDADPSEINSNLCKDTALANLISGNPGQRLPGSWDPFEVAVRAIVGQQVSVKGATTVMSRIVDSYGERFDETMCFPTPESLSALSVDKLSMPTKRAQAIKDMAAAVVNGEIDLSRSGSSEDLIQQMTSIKGIGPWTAQYVTMRALNDPDSFLHTDLVILKVASSLLGIDSEKDMLKRSEAWRPWRAYAGMHLWRHAASLSNPI